MTYSSAKTFRRRNTPLMTKMFSLGFFSIGMLCVAGLLRKDREFMLIKTVVGSSALLVPLVFMIASYLLWHGSTKAAMRSFLIIPAFSLVMALSGHGGGVVESLARFLYRHAAAMGSILLGLLIVVMYGRRLNSAHSISGFLSMIKTSLNNLRIWSTDYAPGSRSEFGSANISGAETPAAIPTAQPLPPGRDLPPDLRERAGKYLFSRNLSLNNIRGLNRLVFTLKNEIDGYIQDRQRAVSYIGEANAKSFLLFGPGGVGKSYFSQCIAGYLRERYHFVVLHVRNTDQLSGASWQASLKSLQDLLDLVKDLRSHGIPLAILWDEIESFIGDSDMPSDGKRNACMKVALDDWHAETGSPFIFIGTSNHPELIFPEMVRPGRMTPVFFGPPDAEARKAIVTANLRGKKIREEEREEIISWIVNNSETATVAELLSFIDRVGSKVYQRIRRERTDDPITLRDFQGETVKITDYQVFLRNMKRAFNHKHLHKLALFRELEGLLSRMAA